MPGRLLPHDHGPPGRWLEDIRRLGADEGLRALLPMPQMPGPDAVGDWLRRMGSEGAQAALQGGLDQLVPRYVEALPAERQQKLTLDLDATLLVAPKGDAARHYRGQRGYHPLLGFLSDGRRDPVCCFARFRPGNASAQAGLAHALGHLQDQLPARIPLRYVRSDSAGYQRTLLEACHHGEIAYSVTADQDSAVKRASGGIPEHAWQPLADRQEFPTGRQWAETLHTMQTLDHAFRLVVAREPVEAGPLFPEHPLWRYWAVATTIPRKHMDGQAVLHHHQGRGNAERWIGQAKDGLGLREVPCGQLRANRIWFGLGMLTFSAVKLMQLLVAPARWAAQTIRVLRTRSLRLAAKVVCHARQVWLKANAPPGVIDHLRTLRRRIAGLAAG